MSNSGHLPPGAISFGEVVQKEMLNEDTLNSYQDVNIGEFLVNPINLNYDLKSLRTALSAVDVRVSPAYIVLQHTQGNNPRYLRWLLHQFDVAHMKTLGAGVRQTITFRDMGPCRVFLPPPVEQERIANFLDEQTARIDALIAEKEKLDSLLSEYRQSLISEAVTGRLNVGAPDAESRGGGAGEGGADVRPLNVRLRHRVEELKTGPFGSALSADEYVDDGVPLVNPSDLRAGRIWPDGAVKVPEEVAAQLAAYRLCDGDLVLGRRGELGRYGLVGPNEAGYLCGTGSLLVRPGASLAAKFLGYYLETPEARDWLSLQSVGSTMENLSEGILARLPIPDRSLREQLEIVNFLDEQTARIDALKAHVKEHIALLREYRSSLISAAVTGQLDLSTFQAAV